MKRQRKDWVTGHTTTYVDQGPCPCCKVYLRLTTDVKPSEGFAEPHPGAMCICIHCRMMSVLDDNLKLRPLTANEVALAMATDPEFSRIYSLTMREHARWKARN